jgi:hypothetical protein
MLRLGKYSIGIGDRFGRQGRAQLRALLMARERGVSIVPVWNKSRREHALTGSRPASVRVEADGATKALGWEASYHVDADHIGLGDVDAFADTHDYFTLDVGELIGQGVDEAAVARFVSRHRALAGRLAISGLDEPFEIDEARLEPIARTYLPAVRQAGRIYRRIAERRGDGRFITEISMDEVDAPQAPEEMLVILAAVADEGIPVQAIAPRLPGRFAKGVDYTGDVEELARGIDRHLCVLRFAREELGLPGSLKLSVHSGSDKLSIYGPIRRALLRHDAGLHLKTAGTTWLEEVIGLCEGGTDGLAIAKEIYGEALGRREELCRPYATVLDIDPARLPEARVVAGWDGETFARALRHDPACADYNRHLRQLVHVAYPLAAAMGRRFLEAVERHEAAIARNVTHNLFERHVRRVFMDG